MCGIVGYVGGKEAYPIIIKGLQRLEYRGYDSAGIALSEGAGITILKQKGKVSSANLIPKKAVNEILCKGGDSIIKTIRKEL